MSTNDTIGSQETTKLLSTDGGVASAPVAANDVVVGVNEEQPDLNVEEVDTRDTWAGLTDRLESDSEDDHEECNCPGYRQGRGDGIDDSVKAEVLANLPDTNLARFCLQRHADEALDYEDTVALSSLDFDIEWVGPNPINTVTKRIEPWAPGLIVVQHMLGGGDYKLRGNKLVDDKREIILHDLSTGEPSEKVIYTEAFTRTNGVAMSLFQFGITFTTTALSVNGIEIYRYKDLSETHVPVEALAQAMLVVAPRELTGITMAGRTAHKDLVATGYFQVTEEGFRVNQDHPFAPYIELALQKLAVGDLVGFSRIQGTIGTYRGMIRADDKYTFGDISELLEGLSNLCAGRIFIKDGVLQIRITTPDESVSTIVPVDVTAYNVLARQDHNVQCEQMKQLAVRVSEFDQDVVALLNASLTKVTYPEKEEENDGPGLDFGRMLRNLRG